MRIQKKFSGQFLGVCIFLVSIIFSMIGGFIFQIDKYKEYSSQITQLNKDIELKEIESSQNEDDIEDIARERLNMVKENEIIYFTEKEVKSN